jgi:hypothetical protein
VEQVPQMQLETAVQSDDPLGKSTAQQFSHAIPLPEQALAQLVSVPL